MFLFRKTKRQVDCSNNQTHNGAIPANASNLAGTSRYRDLYRNGTTGPQSTVPAPLPPVGYFPPIPQVSQVVVLRRGDSVGTLWRRVFFPANHGSFEFATYDVVGPIDIIYVR